MATKKAGKVQTAPTQKRLKEKEIKEKKEKESKKAPKNKYVRRDVVTTLVDGGFRYCVLQHSDSCKGLDGYRKTYEFYTNYSPDISSDVTPICKECLKSFCDTPHGKIDKRKLYKAMQLIDRPYISELVDLSIDNVGTMTAKKNTSPTGEYMRLINAANRDKLFIDSDNSIRAQEEADKSKLEEEVVITGHLRVKWSSVVDPSDDDSIRFLETIYEQYISFFRVDRNDPTKTSIIIDLAANELNTKKLRTSDIPVKDPVKFQSALKGYAGIKTQLMKLGEFDPSSVSKKNDTFNIGNFILEKEKTRPFAEAEGEFRDPDGVIYIIMKFFGHILKMMGKSSDGMMSQINAYRKKSKKSKYEELTGADKDTLEEIDDDDYDGDYDDDENIEIDNGEDDDE